MARHVLLDIALISLAALSATTARAEFGDFVTVPTALSPDMQDSQPSSRRVAMGHSGESIVVWTNSSWYGASVLFAQRFDSAGLAIGESVALSTPFGSDEPAGEAAATIAPDGIATVVWSVAGSGLVKRRVASDGQPIDVSEMVASSFVGSRLLASVASDSLGHVLVTWSSEVPEGGYGVYGQLYNGFGSEQFGSFRIDDSAAVEPVHSVAVMGLCCDARAVWFGPISGSAGAQVIATRLIGLSGEAFGPIVALAEGVVDPVDSQGQATMASDMDGEQNLYLAWANRGDLDVRVARYDSSLWPTYVSSPLAFPAADISSSLHLAVAFDGKGALAWGLPPTGLSKTHVVQLDPVAPPITGTDVLAAIPDYVAQVDGLAVDVDGDVAFAWHSALYPGAPSAIQFVRLRGSSQADLMTYGIAAPGSVTSGTPFEVTMQVRNASFGASSSAAIEQADGVSVRFELPAGVTWSGDPGYGGWRCAMEADLVCLWPYALGPQQWTDLLFLTLNASPLRTTATLTAHVSALQDDPNPSDNVTTATIEIGDNVADAFNWALRTGVARGSEQISDEVTLGGFDVPLSISAFNGSVSINGAAFVGQADGVMAGDRVRVRHIADADFSTLKTTIVTLGQVSGQFATQTEDRDVIPDAFAFADSIDAPRNTMAVSNAVTLSGINDVASISVVGGEYSVDNAAFIASPGTVSPGASIRVRHMTATDFSIQSTTTLTIGGVVGTFTSTTEAVDTTPQPLGLLDQSDLPTGTLVVSAPITISGINSPASVAVSGGSYSVNGAAFTAAPGTVGAGDTLRVQAATASSANSAVDVVVSVGGVVDTFTASTGSLDSTPAAYAFTDVTGARRNRAVTSNAIAVSGINTAVSITVAGGNVTYSKNGGAFTNVPGTVVGGDQIRLRLIASSSANTAISAITHVGGIDATWTVTSGTK